MDDNIVELKIKPKTIIKDQFLVPVPFLECKHYSGPFEIDEKAQKCTCKECGKEVSAIFVLMQLMHKESRWMSNHAVYQDEMKRLAERSKTKCEHCGKLTAISHR